MAFGVDAAAAFLVGVDPNEGVAPLRLGNGGEILGGDEGDFEDVVGGRRVEGGGGSGGGDGGGSRRRLGGGIGHLLAGGGG